MSSRRREQLLAAAPWIVVRGNHESCNRAGQGWWRFLDPRPLAPRQDCNAAADDAIGDYSEPYAVPLGTGRDADTQFIVFDSSLVGVAPLPANDPMHVQLPRAVRARVRARRAAAEHVLHEPSPDSRVRAEPGASRTRRIPGNGALQSVLAALQPTVLFPPNVQGAAVGHVHLFEVVSFSTPQPAQFVSGNGGDWIDTPLPQPLPAGVVPAPGTVMSDARRDEPVRLHDDGARWRALADGRARCARHAAHRVHARSSARRAALRRGRP